MAPNSLSKGAVVDGRFVIQALLGSGAMGNVYRAVDSETRRPVALKVLHREVTGTNALDLAHEARALARLHHPHIAHLVAYGKVRRVEGEVARTVVESLLGHPWLASQLCPGHPLTSWMHRLSLGDFFGVIDGILVALGFAHARGVIHRDLKPDNILVAEGAEGTLHTRIVDFGIARVGDNEVLSNRTVLGTPSYMAPEMCVANHRKVGRASDLYAVGILIYEYICGSAPFRGRSVLEVLDKHVNEDVPLLVPRPGLVVPVGLDEVVQQLLSKSLAHRFKFAAHVRRCLSSLEVPEGHRPTAPAHKGEFTETGATAVLTPQTGPVANARTGARSASSGRRSSPAEALAASAQPLAAGLLEAGQLELVGRADERKQAREHLEAMIERRSARALIITGAAGVGKSRLARWLKELAEEEGLAEPLVSGVGPNAVIPGGGLEPLIERHLRVEWLEREKVSSVLNQELVATGAMKLGDAVQLLDFLRPGESGHGSDQIAHPIGLTMQILQAATRAMPLIVWLDDVSGVDGMIIAELIELMVLSRKITKVPLLVVATLRDPSTPEDQKTWDRVTGLRHMDPRGVVHLELGTLPTADMDMLVGALLPLDTETRARAVDLSAGNPLEAVSLVQHWLQQDALRRNHEGKLSLTHDRIGTAATDAFAQNNLMAALIQSPQASLCRLAVEVGALLGHRIEYRMLAAVVEDLEPMQVEHLPDVWDWLVDRGIWHHPDAGTAVWADAGVRHLVLNTMIKPATAIRLHGALATGIERIYAHELGRHHVELAEHHALAGDYEAATAHLIKAGRFALHQGRLNDAAVAFETVQDVLGEHEFVAAAERNDAAELGLGSVRLEEARYEAVLQHVERVADRARPGVRDAALGQAAFLQAEVARRRGELEFAGKMYLDAISWLEGCGRAWEVARAMEGRAQLLSQLANYEQATEVANAARQRFTAMDDEVGAGRCVLHLGRIEGMRLKFTESERLLKEAIAIFDNTGARQHGAIARIGLSDAYHHTQRSEEGLELVIESMRDALAVGDRELIARAQWAAGTMRIAMGQLDAARQDLEVGLEVAETINSLIVISRLRNAMGELARTQGNFPEAMVQYSAFKATAEAAGDGLSAAMASANIGLVHLEVGEWLPAIDAFDEAVDDISSLGHTTYAHAFAVCRGRAEAEVGRWPAVQVAIENARLIPRVALQGLDDVLDALDHIARLAAADGRIDLQQTALGLANRSS